MAISNYTRCSHFTGVTTTQQCLPFTNSMFFAQMTHFGNMINSSSSNHSLWRRIDYWNSGRGRRRQERQREWWDGKNELERGKKREGAKEQRREREQRILWCRSDMGGLRWGGHNKLSAHKHISTSKQTIPLYSAVLDRSILIFSCLSKPNLSTFPWQTGSYPALRSHEDVCHHSDPTRSLMVKMWPLASLWEPVALPLSDCASPIFSRQTATVTFI